MKLLIAAATINEVKPLEDFLTLLDAQGKLKEHAVEICITGIGGTFTAWQLGKILPMVNWDLAIQLGIGGSFNKTYEMGKLLNVTEEIFADLGAEDGDTFLDIFEMNLMDENKFPFQQKILENKTVFSSTAIDALKKARGISVNKVHGNERRIEATLKRYNPDVESMEGAAFFYSCKMASIPYFEVRCISNLVEKRNKGNWNIPLAVANLNAFAIELINELLIKK
jgi:futalosine hydrolase